MIRLATLDDKEEIFRMAVAFYQQASYNFPVDQEYGYEYILRHLANSECLSLILEVDNQPSGVLLGFATNHPFSPVRVANEIVWWVDPPARGKASLDLLDAFEYWALHKQNCKYICLTSSGDIRLDRLYRRSGYEPKEHSWVREFS